MGIKHGVFLSNPNPWYCSYAVFLFTRAMHGMVYSWYGSVFFLWRTEGKRPQWGFGDVFCIFTVWINNVLPSPWMCNVCQIVLRYIECLLYNAGPDSKVHGANMGPTWVLSAPSGPHVGLMNLAIWGWIVGVLTLSWITPGFHQSILRTCIQTGAFEQYDNICHGGYVCPEPK